MKHKTITVLALILVLSSAACQSILVSTAETIRGSGIVSIQERTVSGFSGIHINLGADLALMQGNTESLSIEADDNLMLSIYLVNAFALTKFLFFFFFFFFLKLYPK
jgi:hypothetical protein